MRDSERPMKDRGMTNSVTGFIQLLSRCAPLPMSSAPIDGRIYVKAVILTSTPLLNKLYTGLRRISFFTVQFLTIIRASGEYIIHALWALPPNLFPSCHYAPTYQTTSSHRRFPTRRGVGDLLSGYLSRTSAQCAVFILKC